ncbi:MAG: glycosyltransferase [Alphaproteobacteria bacterium]|nr:glycosyltransferase [Alphaproteobacteria bacterium SS10]
MAKHLLLIAGMHRSGTSLVTRLVNLAGADLGGDMLPAQDANPKGYWENLSCFKIQEALFDHLGLAWNTPSALPADAFDGGIGGRAVEDLAAVIEDEFADPIAAVKDPKICRLIPIWQRVATATDRDLAVILSLRHPMAVINSLIKRDGMGFNNALLLWLRHTLESERDSRGMPRVVIDYDDCLRDWRSTIGRIGKGLDLEWPVSLDDMAEDADAFVASDLRHNLPADPPAGLAADCVALYRRLLNLGPGEALTDDDIAPLTAYFEAVDAAPDIVNELSRAFMTARNEASDWARRSAGMIAEFEARDQMIEERDTRINQIITDYDQALDQKQDYIDGLEEELKAEAVRHRTTIVDSQSHIAAVTEQRDALKQTLEITYASKSWRITAPLRAVTHFFKVRVARYRYLMVRLFCALRQGDWRAIGRGIKRVLRGAAAASPVKGYDQWVAQYDTLSVEDMRRLRAYADTMQDQPLISVIMPVYKPPMDVLQEAIQSVRDQVYQNWELCLVDDGAGDADTIAFLEAQAAEEPRIKLQVNAHNQNISGATNDAFGLARGDFAAMMDHDDVLRPHALLMVAAALEEHPDADIIYSDEDKVDEKGRRYDPHFKAAWDRDLFWTQNYLNHLTVIRAARIRDVGGWRLGYEGSQDHDLLLRIIEQVPDEKIIHIPLILYHWRAIAGSVAAGAGEKDYAADAAKRALEDHFKRLRMPVEMVPAAPELGIEAFHRAKHGLPAKLPRVSLIVPTKDKVELLKGCVDGLLNDTDYDDLEVLIVDNNSEEQATLDYFKQVSVDERVRVLPFGGRFNFSAINNFAAEQATGSIIGLINNDIEVIHADWLQEMVRHVVRPEIGCVGARLYYANDTVQHAGVICGLLGVASHAHKYFPRSAPGYFGRLVLAHQFTAQTAACLLVRREVYEQVAGLDETLAVAFNDIDFCLRVAAAGYRNLYTPHAELYHLESVSRGLEDTPDKIVRFNSEVQEMLDRWGDFLEVDPSYNPNLGLESENFALASPPRAYRPWSREQWPKAGKALTRTRTTPKGPTQPDASSLIKEVVKPDALVGSVSNPS